MNKTLITLLFVVLLIGVSAVYFRDTLLSNTLFAPTETVVELGETRNEAVAPPRSIAENLEIPWEMVFLPNGEFLVTQRGGILLKVGEDSVAIPINGVEHVGEGGLLGLALHPRFSQNNGIYLYLTTRTDTGLVNRVERYTLEGDTLSDRSVIIDNIPGARFHDGGRIHFGPDNLLYITTGDAGDTQSAQDTESLAGKVLRIRDDGSIPEDNPFGNAVYSYGHRNAQGITWDSNGQLWITEHGRSGIRSGLDEVNRIIIGANYGWPVIEGDETQEGMRAPDVHSGASDTWAPGDIAYYDNHLIFPGLRGSALYVVDISSGTPQELRAFLRNDYGRLRTVVVGPDNLLYVLTSNRDGRGRVSEGDDRIIQIDPAWLGLE